MAWGLSLTFLCGCSILTKCNAPSNLVTYMGTFFTLIILHTIIIFISTLKEATIPYIISSFSRICYTLACGPR